MDYADILVILVMFLVGCLTVAATLFLRRATISMQSSPTNSVTGHTTAEKETSETEEESLEKKEGGMCFHDAGNAKLYCKTPKPTCQHTRVTTHGSNQYVNILKCKDCKQLLSKTPKPAAAD